MGAGQMAPLEEPQQLWGRPGWRETIGKAVAGPRSEKKRRLTALHDVTNPNGEAQIVQADVDSGRTVGRRTMAYVDCTDPRSSSRVIDDDSEDEPMVDRWRRASTTSTRELARLALKPGKGDVTLPSMQIETLGPVWSPLQSPPESNGSTGPPRTGEDNHRHAELLRDILQRL